MSGSIISKASEIRESSVLSHTILPSLEVRKNPPILR